MGKRLDAALFIVVATIVNLLFMALVFLLFVLVLKTFFAHAFSARANAWLLFGLFIASVAITYLVYRAAIRALAKRYPLEERFSLLFSAAPDHDR